MECDLTPKFFKGVLNGVTKKAIFGDKAVTDALILTNLFASSTMSASAKTAFLTAVESMLVEAGRANWTLTDLRAKLDAVFLSCGLRMHRLVFLSFGGRFHRMVFYAYRTRLSEPLKATWLDFWRGQQDKVHTRLSDKSSWTDTVKRLAWRVDLVTSSKATSGQPSAEPTAILELKVGSRVAPKASGTVVFEMNRAQLRGVLDEVERIEAVIARHAGTPTDDDV